VLTQAALQRNEDLKALGVGCSKTSIGPLKTKGIFLQNKQNSSLRYLY
jgi:hypothetical protein